MTRQVKPCGTVAAYHRHIANGEAADEACRKAHSANVYATCGRRQRARIRALGRLARLFPATIAALRDEEAAKGDGTSKANAAAYRRAQGRLARDCEPKVYAVLLAEELARKDRS